MKFVIAEKLDMTQLYTENNDVIAATRVKVGKNAVTQLKSLEKDGYEAVQVGAFEKKNASKPIRSHLGKLITFFSDKAPKYTTEFRTAIEGFKVGDVLSADVFSAGDAIFVAGTSKGKGFAGVVKRHGFAGSPASHGHKDQLRMPGSVGNGTDAGVPKGKRMGGRMGGDRVTMSGLEILKVDGDILYIKGAVPGARGGYLEVYTKDDAKMELSNYFDGKSDSKESAKVEEANEESTEKVEVTAVPDSAETSEKKEAVASEK